MIIEAAVTYKGVKGGLAIELNDNEVEAESIDYDAVFRAFKHLQRAAKEWLEKECHASL